MIPPPEFEEQFGLMVQPVANAIERRRDMFAHAGPVWAGAGHFDLVRRREHAVSAPGHDFHNTLGQFALQKLDQRADLAAALRFYIFSAADWQRLDLDRDAIEIGA